MFWNKNNNISQHQFSSININGNTIKCSGSNVVIQNGAVIVDGAVIDSNIGNNAKIIINGNVNKLDCAGSVEVRGNAGSIDCSGSCKVDGDVHGDVDASGSVTCGNVAGDIDCSGSVRCRR